jgi:hypothetical protein
VNKFGVADVVSKHSAEFGEGFKPTFIIHSSKSSIHVIYTTELSLTENLLSKKLHVETLRLPGNSGLSDMKLPIPGLDFDDVTHVYELYNNCRWF